MLIISNFSIRIFLTVQVLISIIAMYINATDIFREKYHVIPIIKCKKKE